MIKYSVVGNKVYARFAGEEPDSYQLVREFLKNKDLSDYYKNKIKKYADKLTEHGLVGVAKCSPEDEFDIEIGKRIAKARLFKKYYKNKQKVCLEISYFACSLASFTRSMASYFNDTYYECIEEENV